MLCQIKHSVLILCLLLVSNAMYAGRPPGPFLFELTSEDSVYEQGGTIEFTLRITNRDEINAHPVLLPGPKYKGKKFIYLTAHASDQYYTEIVRENGTGAADSAADVYNYLLEPGTHLDVQLKLYHKPRYGVIPSGPHWFSPPLVPGSYWIQAWYMPYDDLELTGSAHQGIEDKSQYNGSTDFLHVRIEPASARPYGKLDQCPDDCGFCSDIEKEKWGRVRRAIEEIVKSPSTSTPLISVKTASRGYWLDQHRNVAYISPLPNAILLSLPAYWGHTIGFRSGDSIHYFKLTVQWGRLFPGRAKLQTIAYWMFRNQILFRTSDVDYVGLKYFKPIPQHNPFPVNNK